MELRMASGKMKAQVTCIRCRKPGPCKCPKPGDATVTLEDVAWEEIGRFWQARRRLAEIAPAVEDWYWLRERERPPRCPPVATQHRAEVEQLLRELAR